MNSQIHGMDTNLSGSLSRMRLATIRMKRQVSNTWLLLCWLEALAEASRVTANLDSGLDLLALWIEYITRGNVPVVLADAIEQTKGMVRNQIILEILVRFGHFLNPTFDLFIRDPVNINSTTTGQSQSRTISWLGTDAWERWYAETNAEVATYASLSTTACFNKRSPC